MACALLRGQRGIGMLGLPRSLSNRRCSLEGSAVLAAASKGSTGRRTSTARTTRTSSSNGLLDAYEPEHLQVPSFPPYSRPTKRTNSIVHNGTSFALFSANSSHSTSDLLLTTPETSTAAETHDMLQHAGLPLDFSTAAEAAVEASEPTAAVASHLQHVTAAATDDTAPLAAPEAAAAAAVEAPPAAAHTAANAAVASAAGSSASSSSTHQASVLVIEAFASSYQVARQMRLVNADAAYTGLRVSAYAAVELDTHSHERSPDAIVLGVERDRYANIHGSLKDAAVQGQLLRFVQRMLQQSADGSCQRINSVVVFASPAADAACNVYSIPSLSRVGLGIDATGRLQQPHNVQQQAMVRQLQQRLYEADRHVSSVLELYRMIQALCAAADEAAQPGQGSTSCSTAPNQDAVHVLQPTLTRLVMAGSWNEEQLLLPMTSKKLEASRQRAAAAAARQRQGLRQASPGSSVISYTTASDTADDHGESEVPDMSSTASVAESDVADVAAAAAALQDDAGAMEIVPLGLHRRPFLEPQLAGSLTGGTLHVSKQPWCMYGELKGDLPPLALITDMRPQLPEGGCICSACDAPVDQAEEAEADTAAAGGADGGRGKSDAALQERPQQAIWPEALVLTLMRMLQGQVAAERAAAAQRASDSAAAAAAAAAAGPVRRGAKRGSGVAKRGGREGRGSGSAVPRGSSSSKAAAKKKDATGSSRARPFLLAPPAPGTSEEERREQLRLFTKPVLAEFTRTVCGLAIKTKIKKDELISKIVEDEKATGKLAAGSGDDETDAGPAVRGTEAA